jgi:hypothetical protein
MNVNALLHFGEIDVNLTDVKQPLVSIMENVCKEQIILDKLSTNVNALLGFGEKIVNLTGVKQPLVSITKNACLEGMILDKFSMNVNALLHFGEIDVLTGVKQPLV